MTQAPIVFPGLHQPSDARHFERACISINRLRRRRKPVGCSEVIFDSAAFTELARYGGYRHGVDVYAADLRRLIRSNILLVQIAVAQDFMCEPFMLAKTGLTVADHQRLTIERYDALLAERVPCALMPVLQGYDPSEYVAHLDAYGDRLALGMWVGVGSVCKRNSRPDAILAVLFAIKRVRPDLRLHGFGVKLTSLLHPGIRELLYSVDSMAWSHSAAQQSGLHVRRLSRAAGRRVKPSEARKIMAARGVVLRDPNDWREAAAFLAQLERTAAAPFDAWQMPLFCGATG